MKFPVKIHWFYRNKFFPCFQLPLPLQTPVAPPPLPPTQLLRVKPQLQQLPPLRPPVLPPPLLQQHQQLPQLSRKSLCRSLEGRPEDKQTPNLFTVKHNLVKPVATPLLLCTTFWDLIFLIFPHFVAVFCVGKNALKTLKTLDKKFLGLQFFWWSHILRCLLIGNLCFEIFINLWHFLELTFFSVILRGSFWKLISQLLENQQLSDNIGSQLSMKTFFWWLTKFFFASV